MVLTMRYSKRRLEQRAFAPRQQQRAAPARPRSSSWSASPRSTELKKAAPRADAEQRLALALFDGSTPALFELGSLGELVGKSARASSQQHRAQLQQQEQRRRRAGSVHSDSGLVLAVQHQRKRVLFRVFSDEDLSDEETSAGPSTPPRSPLQSSTARSAPGTPERAAAHDDAEPKSSKKKKLSSPGEELESLLTGLVTPPQTPPPEQQQQAPAARPVPDSDSLAGDGDGDGARRARLREVESGVALLFDSLFPACCEEAGAEAPLVLGPFADRVKETLRSALAQSAQPQSAQPAAQAPVEDAGALLSAAALTQLICSALRASDSHEPGRGAPSWQQQSRGHDQVPEVRLCKAVLERFPTHGLAFTNALLVCVADSVYAEAGPNGGCPAAQGTPERGGAALRAAARCAAQLATLCDLAQALMATSVSAQSFDLFAALFGRTRRILQRGGGHAAAADLAARALNSCFAVLVRAAPVETVQRVVARMLRSWPPLGTPANALYLDLVDTLLHLCPVRVLAESPAQLKLFQLLAQQLDSPNAAHARRACELLGAPHVIMHYIAPFEKVHVPVSTALFAASRGHWSLPLREMAEALFDELLDFRPPFLPPLVT
jgi:hypothetical protein